MTEDMFSQSETNSSPHPRVSVVLLSYNRPEYLRESLAALLAQSYVNLEIVVVDNPSPASLEINQIVRQYPDVTLIQPEVNLGYTGGMNKGIASVSGHYICLTEDDIVMDENCIKSLVEYMDGHPATGLIAPIIYNKAARTIRWAGGRYELGGVYRMKIFGAGEIDTGQFSDPFEVNFIDGATMFARASLWQSLNGFREDFFMYAEAVDFSIRVAKAGKKLEVVPQAKVYHFEPPERPTPPEIEFHKIKNFFLLYLLHARMRNLPEFVFRYAVLNTLRAMTSRRGNTLLRLKALAWVLRKTPGLLRERYIGAPQENSIASGTLPKPASHRMTEV